MPSFCLSVCLSDCLSVCLFIYLSIHSCQHFSLLSLVLSVRYVFFAIVWMLTWGRHHFWLLPNLTEECGFKESFIPLYTHEYKGKKTDSEPGEDENEDEKEDENLEEKEKQEEAEVDGNKDESGEDKADHTEQESWVKLTEEEVATAISEVAMQGDNESNDLPTSEVKC